MWWRRVIVLTTATSTIACGGETSSDPSIEPPLIRCDFRSDEGTLLLCAETEVGYEEADDCTDETAHALVSPSYSAVPGDGACSESGKMKGCHFSESRTTIWGYGSSGADRATTVCSLSPDGVLRDP